MIKIENVEVVGWEHAIRGMRNPKNSWDKSDTEFGTCNIVGDYQCDNCQYKDKGKDVDVRVCLGPNDHELCSKLAKGGPVHAKYRRMIVVYLDITAPLYWWKEFDTYKVGTVANSCSTMHKIQDKEFTLDDFSHEYFEDSELLPYIIDVLNAYRKLYNNDKKKSDWYQMIQLLPSSYNQKRTVMLNYEVLANMYHSRKNHKLDEWREFCKWIEELPYSELIIGEKE